MENELKKLNELDKLQKDANIIIRCFLQNIDTSIKGFEKNPLLKHYVNVVRDKFNGVEQYLLKEVKGEIQKEIDSIEIKFNNAEKYLEGGEK